MILDMHVDVPEIPGKITRKNVRGHAYVYYELGRDYDPVRKITIPRRVAIGRLEADGRMTPNENFRKHLPHISLPDAFVRESISGCLRVGTFFLVRKLIGDLGLRDSLEGVFNGRGQGLLLDLAAYSIVAEDNSAQYYPDYTYNHPVLTEGMRRYSDSTVSVFFGEMERDQVQEFLDNWNGGRSTRKRIYISYDSTNKNCQAGDIEMVEYGHAKENRGTPIFNYSIAYDQNNCEPLFYEEYPGSVVDVSQLQFMLMKADGFGYRNVGVVLDRGYFSKANILFMREHGVAFVIMVRGLRKLVSSIVEQVRDTFENDRDNYVADYGVYGTTTRSRLYAEDTGESFVHVYYSAGRVASDRCAVEQRYSQAERYLQSIENQVAQIPKTISDCFDLHFDGARFLCGKAKKDVYRREVSLAGYFAIVTSEKMTAAEALRIYKGRDSSEKLFRMDKSFLGNRSARVHSDESLFAKVFVGFIALIIRNRIHFFLKNAKLRDERKKNFMNVPAAIRELEKIEMIRRADGTYTLDHAVTATQKTILRAFGLDENFIIENAKTLGEDIARIEKEVLNEGER
ncbi:transposase [Fibrobacter sp.]|uniref:IS1634 family transposase n=1 Tax=Fibrobacter sp. TaxID=35828 RepID=UPI00388F6A56